MFLLRTAAHASEDNANPYEYLTKPFQVDVLLNIIDKALQQSQTTE